MVSARYRWGGIVLSEILTAFFRLIPSGPTEIAALEVDGVATSFTERAKEAFETKGLAKPVTKIGKLYDVLPEIEQMILAGRPGKEIREWLDESGLTLTEFAYKNYLARARRRKKNIAATAAHAELIEVPSQSVILPERPKTSTEPVREGSSLPVPNTRIIRAESALNIPMNKLPDKRNFI
jgi:hypothetical protein